MIWLALRCSRVQALEGGAVETFDQHIGVGMQPAFVAAWMLTLPPPCFAYVILQAI